jgi:hypothetical protein
VNHPNLVHPIDVGRDGRYFFLALELVEGENLQQRVARGGTLSPLRSLEIVIAVVRALRELEKRRLVHCDVKPSNVLLHSSGDVKLADLGLLRAAGETLPDTRGLLHGTPQYLSPEQARGRVPLDSRSDLYSLGASWFHIVTGRPPYRGRTTAEILDGHLRRPVPVVAGGDHPVPADIADVIRRWLSKDPDDRPSSCKVALAELESLEHRMAAGPVAHRRSQARRSLISGRLSRSGLTYASLVVVGVVVVGLALLAPERRPGGPGTTASWTASRESEPPQVRPPSPGRRGRTGAVGVLLDSGEARELTGNVPEPVSASAREEEAAPATLTGDLAPVSLPLANDGLETIAVPGLGVADEAVRHGSPIPLVKTEIDGRRNDGAALGIDFRATSVAVEGVAVSLTYHFDSVAELQDFRSPPGAWAVSEGELVRRGAAAFAPLHTIAWFELPLRVEGVLSEPASLVVEMGEVTTAKRDVGGPFAVTFLLDSVVLSMGNSSVRLDVSPPEFGRVTLRLSESARIEWLRIHAPLQSDWVTERARLLQEAATGNAAQSTAR